MSTWAPATHRGGLEHSRTSRFHKDPRKRARSRLTQKRTKSRRRNTMASQAFLQARDFLLRHRDDYAAAYKDFAWPELTEFNWALDWFDEYARSNLAPALWVVEENGEETKLSFAELSARSNQLANWLRQQGVQRGDRILLMLPNQPALWETMLAAMKLGAVTIPATILLTADDLAARVAQANVRFWLTDAALAHKFGELNLGVTRIAMGGAPAGWTRYDDL